MGGAWREDAQQQDTSDGGGGEGGRRPAPALAVIKRQFPGWRAWRSDAGRWWATRTSPLPRRIPAGWAQTVEGGTIDGLRDAIEQQEARVTVPDG